MNSEDEGHASEYSYISDNSYDTIDELLKRFTLDYSPEYSLKLRDTNGPLVVGLDFSCDAKGDEKTVAVLAKPTDSTAWWRRAKLTHHGDISLRSRKLRWWVFTLDLEGEVNFLRQTKDLSFRVATAWDITQGRYQNKKRISVMDGVDGRVHWNVNYDLPELSGHFSSKENDQVHDMHASLGSAHAVISKVEVSIWPRNLTFPKSRKILIEGHGQEDVKKEKPWSIESFVQLFKT